MPRLSVSFVALSLLLVGVGCDELVTTEQPAAANKSTCELSLDSLSGEFVYELPATSETDDRLRLRFDSAGTAPSMIATEGTIDKNSYTRTKRRKYDAVYIQDRDIDDINRFKAENKDPNRRLQGKMYVQVNEVKCQLKVAEAFITYVDGKLVEAPIFRDSLYQPGMKTYSWEKCTDPIGLGWRDAPVEASKVSAPKEGSRPLLRAIPANKPGYFFSHVASTDIKDGCSLSFDVYDEDVQVEKNMTAISDAKDGKVMSFERTFKPHNMGRFIELHAFQTCAGKRELLRVSCGVVKPE